MEGSASKAVLDLLDPGQVEAAPGRAWSQAFTGQVDRALAGLLDRYLPEAGRRSGGVALVGLGSYARRSLCPNSDIDLLILHDGWNSRDLESLVRAICYPLWDAGLSVGHAVRTTKEAVRAAGERVDMATALTERRTIAGTAGLADDLAARTSRWLRRSASSLIADIRGADADRHQRQGGSPGALEPELKDGIGGLRDLHSLRWASAVLLGEPGLDPLVGARYIGAADRAELARAGGVLLAARCGLHLVADKGARNTLRLDLQDDVAKVLDMADGDELLHEVGLAMRAISHLHHRTWTLVEQDASRGRRRRRPPPKVLTHDLALVEQLVEVDAAATLSDDPSLGLRAVAAAASHGTVLGRQTAARLRTEVGVASSLKWDERSRTALLELLRSGTKGMGAFGDADHLGLLEGYLPEWPRVRGRPQRNPLHTFDLDTHAMQASAWLTRIVAGELDPQHTAIHQSMEDPDALVLGTWLHDVGKAWPGDHSIAGETIARDWVLHMGFSGTRADRVGRLVRHHLLLPDVATTRDIDDHDEIEAVAAAVGDTELLDALYLLSFADARATGKAAWSSWKDLLITRLYSSVRALLEGDIGVLARPSAPDVVIRVASREGVDEALIRATVAGLPKRYLRVASASQIAAHARLLQDQRTVEAGQDAQLGVDLRPGPAAGTQVISLAAPDRQGMVADCLGVLASQWVQVLEARVFTHSDGTALDWFVVREVRESTWRTIAESLGHAYAGTAEVAERVERREKARDARPPLLAAPVPISVTSGSSGSATRIEVRGPDGPGVLYHLTRALATLDASLLGARIATLGPEVRDTFFMRGDVPSEAVLTELLTPAFDAAAGRD